MLADVVSLESAVIDDQCLGAMGGTDPGETDDSTDDDGDDSAVSFIDNASGDDDSAEDQEYNGDIDIGPFTQEHMNYARLCNVIVTLGADALRDVLVTQVPVQYTDIYRALLGNIAAIRGMRQIGREQFQLIFQDPQFRYTGTADQFDITLLYTLIRNISSCQAPATGWGRPPDDLPRDVSLGASVERIRLMRNKVSGHSADGKLADQAYEDHMDEIKQILDDIEVVLGDCGYKDAFEKRRKQIITTQEAQALRKKFENYQQHLKGKCANFNHLCINVISLKFDTVVSGWSMAYIERSQVIIPQKIVLSLKIDFVSLIKCCIMRHFICVFTVRQSTCFRGFWP